LPPHFQKKKKKKKKKKALEQVTREHYEMQRGATNVQPNPEQIQDVLGYYAGLCEIKLRRVKFKDLIWEKEYW